MWCVEDFLKTNCLIHNKFLKPILVKTVFVLFADVK